MWISKMYNNEKKKDDTLVSISAKPHQHQRGHLFAPRSICVPNTTLPAGPSKHGDCVSTHFKSDSTDTE